MSDLQEVAHLLQETKRVSRNAKAASDIASITSVFESTKLLQQRVSALDRSSQQESRPLSASLDAPTTTSRPSILALSDNGSLARVEVEKKGIHIYCLQPPSTAYSVAIKVRAY